MPSEPSHTRPARSTLSLKIGSWFEAHATGWGVLAAPAALALLVGVALARLLI